METFPLVISFYTKNTQYELEVQNLIASCEKWNLEHFIEGIDSFGKWELNCAYKPFFIFNTLKRLQRPLLWVDADGVFVRHPEVIDAFNSDFATRINEELPQDHHSKVISSTIFLNYSEKTLQLLRQWMENCKKTLTDEERKEEFWDQIALRDALFDNSFNAVIKPLPISYAKIFDHPLDLSSAPEAVLEHYQASRRFKKLVDTQRYW